MFAAAAPPLLPLPPISTPDPTASVALRFCPLDDDDPAPVGRARFIGAACVSLTVVFKKSKSGSASTHCLLRDAKESKSVSHQTSATVKRGESYMCLAVSVLEDFSSLAMTAAALEIKSAAKSSKLLPAYKRA